MRYRSTRGGDAVSAAEALLKGLAEDGGLYVPEKLPEPFLSYEEIKNFSYQETAVHVLRRFFEEIPEAELAEFVRKGRNLSEKPTARPSRRGRSFRCIR